MCNDINIYKESISLFYDSEETFKTSLDIIQEVMNVPMCALTSMLRVNGYNDEIETASFCIDEKKLGIFADAYIRKVRSYFFSSLRHIGELSSKELSDFIEFVNLFKKKGVACESCKWSDINTGHLREVFIEKVKNKTKKESSYTCSEIDALIVLSNYLLVIDNRCFQRLNTIQDRKKTIREIEEQLYDNSNIILSSSYSLFTEEKFFNEGQKKQLGEKERISLDKISHSNLYVVKDKIIQHKNPVVLIIMWIIVYARYYLYPKESDDDSHNISFRMYEILV